MYTFYSQYIQCHHENLDASVTGSFYEAALLISEEVKKTVNRMLFTFILNTSFHDLSAHSIT